MPEGDLSTLKGGLSKVQARRKAAIFLSAVIVMGLIPFVESHSALAGGTHEFVEMVGLGLIVLCVLGRSWCSLYIGGRKTKTLVRSGPYSLSRNPLYMFSFIGAFGVGAQSGSVLIAIIFLLIAFLIFFPVICKEENALRGIFSDSYRHYERTTPRFGPRFSAWKDDVTIEVRLPLLYRTLADGLFFFAAIPIFESVEKAQQLGYLTSILTLP